MFSLVVGQVTLCIFYFVFYVFIFHFVFVHMSAGTHRSQQRASDPLGAGVPGGYEPLATGSGNNLSPHKSIIVLSTTEPPSQCLYFS